MELGAYPSDLTNEEWSFAKASSAAGNQFLSPERIRALVKPYRVTNGEDFRLKRFDPADTGGQVAGKQEAEALLSDGVAALSGLQEKLYADGRWSMLCVFQAMDAAGKNGTIKHVMSGVNPQGVQVTNFKAPGPADLAHDFLWRPTLALPLQGNIGIWNRSHYEEVLVTRVHPDILARQKLPPSLTGKHIWRDRLKSIRNFEAHLSRQGTVIAKFFLNVSREEQRKRFVARLDDPSKTGSSPPLTSLSASSGTAIKTPTRTR